MYVCMKMASPSYRTDLVCEKTTSASEWFGVNNSKFEWLHQQSQLNLVETANFFLLSYHKLYGLCNKIALAIYKRQNSMNPIVNLEGLCFRFSLLSAIDTIWSVRVVITSLVLWRQFELRISIWRGRFHRAENLTWLVIRYLFLSFFIC